MPPLLRSLSGRHESQLAAEADLEVRLCEARYLRPDPRLRAGMLLGRNRAASACIDLSDGLADGIRQIAEASEAGIVVDGASVPISEEASRWYARRGQDPVEASLAGGDDYELLFTVRPSHHGRLRAAQRKWRPARLQDRRGDERTAADRPRTGRRPRPAAWVRTFQMKHPRRMGRLSGSIALKGLATLVAIGAFVLLYEATTFDSREAAGNVSVVDPTAPVTGARLDFQATVLQGRRTRRAWWCAPVSPPQTRRSSLSVAS